MKAPLLLALSFAALPSLFAADEPAAAATPGTGNTVIVTETIPVQAAAPALPDAYVMAAGSVLAVRGKESTRLQLETKLRDGSVITPGGTVRRPDGTTVTLADGQAIMLTGELGKAPAGYATDVGLPTDRTTPTTGGTTAVKAQ